MKATVAENSMADTLPNLPNTITTSPSCNQGGDFFADGRDGHEDIKFSPVTGVFLHLLEKIRHTDTQGIGRVPGSRGSTRHQKQHGVLPRQILLQRDNMQGKGRGIDLRTGYCQAKAKRLKIAYILQQLVFFASYWRKYAMGV